MPTYKLERQGYNIIVKDFRVVHSGVCAKINHEMRFDVASLNHPQMLSRNKLINDFMSIMNGRVYTPDGPTLYCKDCQESCQYQGMEG